MQFLSVQIEDNYFQDFMNYIQKYRSGITITKDRNLEQDPYFYERQAKLHHTRDEVKSGNMKLLSQEESDAEIELFFRNQE